MKSNIAHLKNPVKSRFLRCQNWCRKADEYGHEYRLRCRHKAISRLTLGMANGDCIIEDRCESCATSLREVVANGAKGTNGAALEILDDQPIVDRIRFNGESETYF